MEDTTGTKTLAVYLAHLLHCPKKKQFHFLSLAVVPFVFKGSVSHSETLHVSSYSFTGFSCDAGVTPIPSPCLSL